MLKQIFCKARINLFPLLKLIHDQLNQSHLYLLAKQISRSSIIFKSAMLILSAIFISTRKYEANIAPQVNNEFAGAIAKVLDDDSVNKVVEIGSSGGGGSTQVIIDNLLRKKNTICAELHLVEISPVRAELLQQKFGHLHFVKIHNKSTVNPREHVSPRWLLEFNQRNETILRNRSIFRPLRWLREDIKYLRENPSLWEPTAFEIIFRSLRPEDIDFALIDGGFCGFLDTQRVLGARYIALDDVNDPKNFESFRFLQSSKNYKLIDKNFTYRNGYAVFKRL